MKRIILLFFAVAALTASAQTDNAVATGFNGARVFTFGYLSYETALKSMPQYAEVQQTLAQLREQYQAETLRVEDEFNRKYEDFLEGQRDFPRTILQKRQTELQELMEKNIKFKENSRKERLVEFKRAYGRSKRTFAALLEKTFPEKPEEERGEMLIAAFEFMHGIYPYAHATVKQKEAMDEAGVQYEEKSIYEHALNGLKRILV